MGTRLIVASSNGIVILSRQDGEWAQTSGAMTKQAFTSVAASEAGNDLGVLVGAEDGIHRSADAGSTWWEFNEGLSTQHVRWLTFHPDESGLAFAGTEPAAIFYTENLGETWQECPEVAMLRSRHGWNLPYSPAAGCVRGFAFHGNRGYAAVEQGGLLRSDDRGATWQLVQGATGTPGGAQPDSYIHPDVHSVLVHPSSADQVFAPTGGGFYYSTDGGEIWELLYRCYCRAVWVDPERPARIILGPADGVDRNGRIEESIDGGKTWEAAGTGMETPWSRHMVERFLQVDDELLAVLSNGRLIAAPLDTFEWKELLPALQDVRAVAVLTV